MTILITGAAGRTSGYVIERLLASSAQPDIRLLVRSQASAEKVRTRFPTLPQSAFVIGDFLETHTLPPAVQGVDIVFYNAPAFHPLESAMGIAMIEAAKESGVKHFVLCSVLFPLLTKLLNHIAKLSIEEHLIESGLNYTILQPTSFMQNINIMDTVTRSVLVAPYSPKVLQGFVDLRDLADVTCKVLDNPSAHNRARYELVSENSTLESVAGVIASVSGHSYIPIEHVPEKDVASRGLVPAQGYTAYSREGLERMIYYYNSRGIPGNNNTMRWLLQREPTSWESFVRRELQG
ncbi:NAD(P)-binding protein [Panus rudis PR-1116 ss-1]|nr:NAD(P)-binding protein [Panus rudis PR-1116 ss-1]